MSALGPYIEGVRGHTLKWAQKRKVRKEGLGPGKRAGPTNSLGTGDQGRGKGPGLSENSKFGGTQNSLVGRQGLEGGVGRLFIV